jgi:hypothetical protein
MTKSRKSRIKPFKGLPEKKVATREARSVRGGALAAYLSLKGQKQGEIKK